MCVSSASARSKMPKVNFRHSIPTCRIVDAILLCIFPCVLHQRRLGAAARREAITVRNARIFCQLILVFAGNNDDFVFISLPESGCKNQCEGKKNK